MIRNDKTSLSLCFLLLATVLFPAAPRPAVSQQAGLSIAAAADLQYAMDDLARQFQEQTHNKVDVTYGSSGNFVSQIVNGAPFDLFFSADLEYPRKLGSAGLIEPGTLFTYALGRIVLWAPAGTTIDVAKLQWNALVDHGVQKIALANPQHAPYGRAAISALRNAGIYDKVRDKLVYGENASQAAQFVQSGNAQVGIIPKSLALSPPMKAGQRWDIPASAFLPIEQAAVILKNSQNQHTARSFLDFVRSKTGRAILANYGFALPESMTPVLSSEPRRSH